MTVNERIDDWNKKIIKLSMDHKRLMKEIPTDSKYHEGMSDLATALSVEFRIDFDKEIKQYAKETNT